MFPKYLYTVGIDLMATMFVCSLDRHPLNSARKIGVALIAAIWDRPAWKCPSASKVWLGGPQPHRGNFWTCSAFSKVNEAIVPGNNTASIESPLAADPH